MDEVLQVVVPVGMVCVVVFAVVGAVWFLGRVSDWLTGMGPKPGTPEFAAQEKRRQEQNESEPGFCLCGGTSISAGMICPLCGGWKVFDDDLTDPANPASPLFNDFHDHRDPFDEW